MARSVLGRSSNGPWPEGRGTQPGGRQAEGLAPVSQPDLARGFRGMLTRRVANRNRVVRVCNALNNSSLLRLLARGRSNFEGIRRAVGSRTRKPAAPAPVHGDYGAFCVRHILDWTFGLGLRTLFRARLRPVWQ